MTQKNEMFVSYINSLKDVMLHNEDNKGTILSLIVQLKR